MENFERQHSRYLSELAIITKTNAQIAGIRRASEIAVEILSKLCRFAEEGVTTKEIDLLSIKLHKELGAIPAPLGYGDPPFPASVCTSLNDVICHGIPDSTGLQNGDILNIDVTAIVNGYYGDCSAMVLIGDPDGDKRLVVDVAKEALLKAIKVLSPGEFTSKIGAEIEPYAKSMGCSVVTQFVSHGVGLSFHENPQIPHHINSTKVPMAPGMTFTIEPMINAGIKEAVIDKTDKWTARTADNKASAQWEVTVLITDNGHEILTPITHLM